MPYVRDESNLAPRLRAEAVGVAVGGMKQEQYERRSSATEGASAAAATDSH